MKQVPSLLRAAAITLAAISAVPDAARAQAYPSQDVQFICGFAAGSGADIIVRYFADKMRPLMNRTIIVQNKPGAIGNIATEFVARSKPDGHTIYITGGNGVAANMHLFKKPPVDAANAFQIAATINQATMMVAVPADGPVKTIAELTAVMKQKGSKATYGFANPTSRVLGAMYKEKAGLQAVEVALPHRRRLPQSALLRQDRLRRRRHRPGHGEGGRRPHAPARRRCKHAHAGGTGSLRP